MKMTLEFRQLCHFPYLVLLYYDLGAFPESIVISLSLFEAMIPQHATPVISVKNKAHASQNMLYKGSYDLFLLFFRKK
jgi:hypothetical protein